MKAFGIFLVRAYQVTLGPLFGGACRFEPSCSNYAIGAIGRFGFFRGSWLAARRILRCRPFGASGADPVPETWPGWFRRVSRPV
ncbi:MAG: membrane protein insertion efficiency factor YidD [Kiritimatiellae bacterium]|nr:membrane protein insertion efficiency factor YidD [Kiritimatiellia bacterium]